VTPTSSPILPTTPTQEVVLFVGYPCMGKSTFYRRYFQPAQYLHINQDTLKTREKCVKALQEAMKAGQSCVIGKIRSITNHFLRLISSQIIQIVTLQHANFIWIYARRIIYQPGKTVFVACVSFDLRADIFYIRCFLFDGSIELAWHNNLYRAFNMPPSSAPKEVRNLLSGNGTPQTFR
jgi:bifunctional polynucleotide phosphatase/kinase